MENNLIPLRFQAFKLCSQYPLLVCDSFQLLLLLIAFTNAIRNLAGIAVIVLFVLIAARILCIYSGNYFYYFPKGMQI